MKKRPERRRTDCKGKRQPFLFLMTHNTRVSLFTFAMGFTWGIGTVVLLFYNGIILGATSLDFIQAGQSTFLLGWLLPHGAIEIPAIIVAGQAGFILAGALIGWGRRFSLKKRLRAGRSGAGHAPLRPGADAGVGWDRRGLFLSVP